MKPPNGHNGTAPQPREFPHLIPPLTYYEATRVLLAELERTLQAAYDNRGVRERFSDEWARLQFRLRQVQAWGREIEDMGLAPPSYADNDDLGAAVRK